jgi:hypothetical protein
MRAAPLALVSRRRRLVCQSRVDSYEQTRRSGDVVRFTRLRGHDSEDLAKPYYETDPALCL